MKRSILPSKKQVKHVCHILEACLLLGITVACGTPISRTVIILPTSASGTPFNAATVLPALEVETWRQSMQLLPLPKEGCFQASYPSTSWQEVPCTTAPAYPQLPGSRSHASSVGNGNSYTAQVQGSITSVVGSFDSITGLTSEVGTQFSSACASPVTNVPNTFTLQINTNVFSTGTLGCDQRRSCKGWQQFIYSNTGKAYVQNWLIDYGTPCPQDWTADGDDCYLSQTAASVPTQDIGYLARLGMTAISTNRMNTVILSIKRSDSSPADQLIAMGQEDILNLAPGWNSAEFNIFGDGCKSQAIFNAGTALKVRTNISANPTGSIACLAKGFTEETNNLDLRNCSSYGGAGLPAGIMFEESH